MKIHTGDTVVVISGKDKGKQGTVMRILQTQNRVVVEGINMRTRHIKKTQNGAGSKVSYEASIHASNVMILDPKTKKPTRIGYKIDEKGKKSRIAMASGEVIAKAATAKGAKKATKTAKDTDAPKEKKSDAKPAATPAKSPFWKRGAQAEGSEETGGAKESVDTNVIQTAHRSQGG